MWSVAIQMPNLPLGITCFADAQVSFAPYARFDVVIDQVEEGGFQVVANEQQIMLGNSETLEYNTKYPYKSKPVLLKWLQSLNMDMPNFQQQG